MVHVIHAADGMIPSDMATGDDDEIEEERRLLYVAMTRARDALHVTFPMRYYRRPRGLEDPHSYAQLSRFLEPETVRGLLRAAGARSPTPGRTTDVRWTSRARRTWTGSSRRCGRSDRRRPVGSARRDDPALSHRAPGSVRHPRVERVGGLARRDGGRAGHHHGAGGPGVRRHAARHAASGANSDAAADLAAVIRETGVEVSPERLAWSERTGAHLHRRRPPSVRRVAGRAAGTPRAGREDRAREQLLAQHPSGRGPAAPGGRDRRRGAVVRGGRAQAGPRDLPRGAPRARVRTPAAPCSWTTSRPTATARRPWASTRGSSCGTARRWRGARRPRTGTAVITSLDALL